MKTHISKLGLRVTLQRMINILQNQINIPSVSKHMEFSIITNEEKKILVCLKEFIESNEVGYNVILDFSHYNNESDTISSNILYHFWKDIPCFSCTKSRFVISNINSECLQFYDNTIDPIDHMLNLINIAINLSICQCNKNVILDDESICLTCNLGLKDECNKVHFCSICQTKNYSTIIKLNCCNQYIHEQCLNSYKKINPISSRNCPLCKYI